MGTLEQELGDLSTTYLTLPWPKEKGRQPIGFQIMLVKVFVILLRGKMLGLGKEMCVKFGKFHMGRRGNVNDALNTLKVLYLTYRTLVLINETGT